MAFSSLELLTTLRMALLSGLPLHLMTDGTHKVSFNKWVLLTVGTTTIRKSSFKRKLVNTFLPIAFCFARSETAPAFLTLFRGLSSTCRELFGVALDPSAVVSDKGSGVVLAIRTMFPAAKVTPVYLFVYKLESGRTTEFA